MDNTTKPEGGKNTDSSKKMISVNLTNEKEKEKSEGVKKFGINHDIYDLSGKRTPDKFQKFRKI